MALVQTPDLASLLVGLCIGALLPRFTDQTEHSVYRTILLAVQAAFAAQREERELRPPCSLPSCAVRGCRRDHSGPLLDTSGPITPNAFGLPKILGQFPLGAELPPSGSRVYQDYLLSKENPPPPGGHGDKRIAPIRLVILYRMKDADPDDLVYAGLCYSPTAPAHDNGWVKLPETYFCGGDPDEYAGRFEMFGDDRSALDKLLRELSLSPP
jgi:hypothetical protein